MFCPKCARKAAGGVQFCQQCGQQLGEVRRLLDAGDAPALTKPAGGAVKLAQRRGVRQGFKLSLLALFVLPFYPLVEALMDELVPSVENTRLDELPMELFGTLIFVLFFAGLARMLYAYLFEEKAAGEAAGELPKELSGERGRQALPPSQSMPAADFFSPRVSTADLAAAPHGSVTEHTTRGLRRD